MQTEYVLYVCDTTIRKRKKNMVFFKREKNTQPLLEPFPPPVSQLTEKERDRKRELCSVIGSGYERDFYKPRLGKERK